MNNLQQLKLYAHLNKKGMKEEVEMINEFTKKNCEEAIIHQAKRRYQWYHAHCHCCSKRNQFVCALDNRFSKNDPYHVCTNCLKSALFNEENKKVKKNG